MTVAVNVERKAVEVTWDADASDTETVTLYAQGADEEWHNTNEIVERRQGGAQLPG